MALRVASTNPCLIHSPIRYTEPFRIFRGVNPRSDNRTPLPLMGGNVNGLSLIAAHHHTERKIPGTTSHYPATSLYGRNSPDDPFPMPRLALTPPSFPTTEAITVWRLSPETLSPQHRHPPAIRRSGSRFIKLHPADRRTTAI